MSTDIAQLGLQVDSRQVVSAKKALDDLTASAKPAAAAAASVEKATVNAGKGAQQLATGTGLARHEMINLSRQIQDVGVSLASGQSFGTVLIQQGTQIADIFGSSKTGSVGGALKQIVNYIGPVRLVGLGVAGIATAGYLASSALQGSLKALDDVAKSAGTTLGALHGLQTAASFKGISNDDFLKGMSKFADDVYQAKNNMGQLAGFLRANGMSAKSFEDALAIVADKMKDAQSYAQRLQILQEAGLPVNMQWAKYLAQGGDAIRTAIKAGDEFNNGPAGKMVTRAREFDDAWNIATTNIANRFKGWLLSLDDLTFGAIDKFRQLAANSYGSGMPTPRRISITGGTTEPAGPKIKTLAERQKEITDRQTYLGLLSQTATAEQAAEQIRLQAASAYLSTGVSVGKKKIELLQQLVREQTIGVTAIKAGTDAANIDAATVGMSIGKANRYAAAQNALNEARRVGRELTPENIAQIQREAAALGAAAGQVDLLRFSYESLVRGPLQTFQSAIANGATAWDAFKKAGASALNSIASKLADMAAQNLWASAFGGGGGGGGFLGGLFGLGGGSAPVMSGAGLGAGTGGLSFPMFANGTNSAPGGWSVVGEKGPELMNVPKGAQIFSNDNSRQMLGGGGGAQNVHVTVGVSVDDNGNLQALVKDVSAATVNGAMASPGFVDRVGAASVKARSRRLTR